MYCDKCGQELREGARYCSKCGTKIENEDEFITQDNLNEAGKKESYDDRYENVQHDRNEPVSNQNRSRKNKLIVLFTIIGLTVAVAITAIILYVTLNSSTPAKNVYKKYLQVLENTKDNIVEFENDCGVNGVAFYDINHSGVSDVLYITKNDTTEANADRWYLHCLSDVEEDIKIDAEEDIPGGVQDWETLFITDKDNCIYVLNKNRLYSLVFEKDEAGKGKYRVEMLAQRVYDNAEEEYSCTLKSVSGEMKSISENEYNEYIDEICGRNLNILISTLKDEELEKVFPYIDKCFSVNSNDAIKRLKNGNVTVGGEDHHFAEILDKETKVIESNIPLEPTDEPQTEEPTSPPARTEAIKDYKQMYVDFLNDYDESYISGELFYINDDDIPELILYTDYGAHAAVFQFCWIDNGIVHNEEFTAALFTYKERNGELFSGIGGNMSSGWNLFTFDGVSFYSLKNGSRIVELVNTTEGYITHYSINDEEVSEDEFNEIPNEAQNWTRIQTNNWTDKTSLVNYIDKY